MNVRLYYKYIYMPPSITSIPKTRYENIYISDHALESFEDRDIPFFADVEFCGKDILEARVENNKIVEMLLEQPYDDEYNIHILLNFRAIKSENHDNDKITLKTVYLRDKFRIDTINKDNEKYYHPVNMG